jgi:dual specificity tyrosine-phosphorylation-regulated kinase 2/3/4
VEGLNYLKHIQIIHCDLKPENILYSDESKGFIKIIDFGSSCSRSEEGYSYVQSRFYRAPEVILGLPYDNQVDMWSLGCIIAELYSGRPLFPGTDENEMLEFVALICGIVPQHMIDKGKKRDKFFNTDNGYRIIRS